MSKLRLTPYAPKESDEQAEVIDWCAEMVHWKKHPELAGIFAIPNGSVLAGDNRHRAIQMARLKAQGLRPGIPDLALPISRRGFAALFIEMKSTRPDARETEEQIAWRAWLNAHGNHAVVCAGAKEAIAILTWYLGGDRAYPQLSKEQ